MATKKEREDLRLMMEKMNSDSPNHRTPKTLIAHTRIHTAAVYAAWWLICGYMR